MQVVERRHKQATCTFVHFAEVSSVFGRAIAHVLNAVTAHANPLMFLTFEVLVNQSDVCKQHVVLFPVGSFIGLSYFPAIGLPVLPGTYTSAVPGLLLASASSNCLRGGWSNGFPAGPPDRFPPGPSASPPGLPGVLANLHPPIQCAPLVRAQSATATHLPC